MFLQSNIYSSVLLVLFIAFCLGGTDSVTEGTFMWASSNKGITTTDWNIGQPDNYQDRQDCLCMESTFNYRWDDADCATQHQYICETPYV